MGLSLKWFSQIFPKKIGMLRDWSGVWLRRGISGVVSGSDRKGLREGAVGGWDCECGRGIGSLERRQKIPDRFRGGGGGGAKGER